MSVTLKFEAVAKIGEDKNGKAKYQKCGVVFESEKGLSLKLDCIPVGPGWNGWISLYEPRPKEERQPQKPATPAPSEDDPFGDGIPF